jgi:hypothetical protein
MSPGRRSAWPAALAVAIALTTLVELVPHRHAVGELDLAAHDVARVTATEDCGGGFHLDRAETDRHPACAACLLSSVPADRASGRIAFRGAAPSLSAIELAELPPRPAETAGSFRGRAPPATLLEPA